MLDGKRYHVLNIAFMIGGRLLK